MTSPTDRHAPRYPVRLVASRTGLSPHVLRAWERRYQVVTPTRSEGGQRLYSDLDIERLQLLTRLTDRGHAIGRIAGLPLEELARLDREASPPRLPVDRATDGEADGAGGSVEAALAAARRYDAAELQAVLERAAVTLGVPAFLEDVAVPVVDRIGHGWAEGTVSVAQEHMATAVLRRILSWLMGVFEVHGAARQAVVAKQLLVATPPSQVHELGALLVAVSAAAEGWRVSYLGADLPAGEIIAAARDTAADVVALSVVYDAGEPSLIPALREVRDGLAEHVPLIVGGAAASRQRRQAEAAGAVVVDSLPDFRALLRRLGEEGEPR